MTINEHTGEYTTELLHEPLDLLVATTELLREVEARRSLPPPDRRRSIRISAGVSQAKLAAALGVSDVTVLRWEHGDTTPRGSTLIAYVELLDRLRSAS